MNGSDGGEAPEAGSRVPAWRREFPHTSAGEDAVTRRAFARYLIAGSGAFAAAGVGTALWSSLRSLPEGSPEPIIALDRLPEGESHLFDYPGADDPAILLHLPGGRLVAYSQRCTHLGCVVYWDRDSSELVCPCHEGFFDPATGEPTAGPPERPLPEIRVEVRDGTVRALGIDR